MALTKTVAEVKEMLPNFVSNLSKNESLPNFDAADTKYLVPLVGIDLYNYLQNKYDAETLTADETKLVKKIRMVSVAHAYADGIALGDVTITDSGPRSFSPNNSTPIPKWKHEKVQLTLLNIAYDATEVLLQWLFENKDDYALWTTSNEYKDITGLLIKTGTDFNKQYSLYQPMRTFFNIRNVIADMQEFYLKDSIGADLLTYLVELATPDDSLQPIINKLKKSLAFYTVKKCCEQFTVRFSMEGLTVMATGDSDHADQSGRKSADPIDLDMKMRSAEKDGRNYLEKAKYELWKYRNGEYDDAPATEFNTAYDAGPLATYADPGETTSGNETRKGIFRL